jgi:hypothetical protein
MVPETGGIVARTLWGESANHKYGWEKSVSLCQWQKRGAVAGSVRVRNVGCDDDHRIHRVSKVKGRENRSWGGAGGSPGQVSRRDGWWANRKIEWDI